MGCINSKKAVVGASPEYVHSTSRHDHGSGGGGAIVNPPSSRTHSGVLVLEPKGDPKSEDRKKFRKDGSKKSASFSFRLGFSHRYVEAEQNAAGWPPWLTAAAAEAIQGWVPLRADSFQKLDKIGQGTYSSVFQAREVETGRMFALKKVRFDNFQPESIRFMAREITILRRLDHPNIMKLEGIIASRVSSSIYLVFEYMEHDLAGLVANPDIKFSDSQIKCYMRQLLSGLEHCHVRGIMHRDIKVSNILVNNEGILKIGDFGLANTLSPNNKHHLTSRVVTLWYRPPELLMGSTNYGVSVDLWSVGCVFAELFLGKPIIKGRTEVEQLHKIFKLCGSPPDEFWKNCKLPHATMFKPQINYESSLQERCKDFPVTAVNLIETLLSIDPYKRGTASSALMSEYFSTKPYACNPSSLPKYPPTKEMDARSREDVGRKKTGGKLREAATSRRQRRVSKVLQEPNNFSKPASKENVSQNARKDDGKAHLTKGKGAAMHKEQPKHSQDAMSEAPRMMNVANGYSVRSAVPVAGSSGFTWAKRRKPDASSTLSDGSRSKISALDPTFAKGTYDLTNQRIDVLERKYNDNVGHHQAQHDQPEFFGVANAHPSNVSMDFDPTELTDTLINTQGHRQQGVHLDQSASLMNRTNKNDELLLWNENSMRRAVRKSRFGRDK